jgi:ribosomal protein S18 acetylase RimI-like enzyme
MDFDGKAMAFLVRAASVADIDALVRLNRDVQLLHAEFEPAYFKARTAADEVGAFFGARLATPGNHIRLSEGDTGPNGYVWFEVQERPETPFTRPGRRIYVHHLAVQKTARRRGIASALLGQVEIEALSAGIDSIVLDVWAANESARGLFAAHGFTAFNLMLRKGLA